MPTQDEIEKASEFLQKGELEDSAYFAKYNNQIFLQKKKTKHLKKYQSKQEDNETLDQFEYPTESRKVIFEIFDNYKNETIIFNDF